MSSTSVPPLHAFFEHTKALGDRLGDKLSPAVRGGMSGVVAAAGHVLSKLQPAAEAPAAVAATPTPVVAPAAPVVAAAPVAAPVEAPSSSGGAAFVAVIVLTLFLGALLLTRYDYLAELIAGATSPRAKASAAAPAAAPPAKAESPAPAATQPPLRVTRGPAAARTMLMDQSYVEVAGADDADAGFEIVGRHAWA